MARFTGTSSEAGRWRANVLDVRSSYMFYGREENADGVTIFTYHNTPPTPAVSRRNWSGSASPRR